MPAWETREPSIKGTVKMLSIKCMGKRLLWLLCIFNERGWKGRRMLHDTRSQCQVCRWARWYPGTICVFVCSENCLIKDNITSERLTCGLWQENCYSRFIHSLQLVSQTTKHDIDYMTLHWFSRRYCLKRLTIQKTKCIQQWRYYPRVQKSIVHKHISNRQKQLQAFILE